MTTPHRTTITWDQGGEAEVVRAQGVQATVRSTKPFPPGAPVQGTLLGPTSVTFTLKVASIRKVQEQVWEIHGRLITATAEVLAAFARNSVET
jgi:hypothetical protein